MAGVARLKDICTGHGDFPPRPIIEGSSNVFVNGKPCARIGDELDVHCNMDPSCHKGNVATGSGSVFANGIGVGRLGDKVSCGGTIATASGNVFAG